MTREEFIDKWGASMGHGFTDEELSTDLDSVFKYVDNMLAYKSSPPSAEDAEEIPPTAYEWHNLKTGHCYVDYVPKADMDEQNGYTKTPLYKSEEVNYVTGHGLDKLVTAEVDKRVSERLREELTDFYLWIRDFDKNSSWRANFEATVIEYLKSRDKP